jgi:hypothetical protein
LDPITAFATAQAAVAGVKAAINLYKDVKGTAKDIHSIAHEVTFHLGSFFEAQEVVAKASSQKSLNPLKRLSVDSEAMENVMRVRQLQQYEIELRELIIYQCPYPGLWDDFQLERRRIREERAEEEAQQRRLEARARKLKQEFKEKVVLYGLIVGSVLFVISVVSYMFYLIAEYARS